MNVAQKLISGYLFIALLYTLYGWFINPYGGHGYAYNLGIAIVWPIIIFPGLGKIIGGTIMVIIVLAILRK